MPRIRSASASCAETEQATHTVAANRSVLMNLFMFANRRDVQAAAATLFEKIFPLEKDNIEYGDRDVAVGDDENGTEDGEVPAAYDRHPVVPRGVDNRKMRHVHRLPVQERRITAPFGKERGRRIGSRFGEDE